jgi:drug/metabolite transporter (DMT)-like permease
LMLGLLAVQGALGALAMTAITRAVSLADVSAVIPFDFLRLPLVAFGAYYFFGQSADVATWIGAAVIFLAGVLASRRLDRTGRVPVRGSDPGGVAEVGVADQGAGAGKEENRPKQG